MTTKSRLPRVVRPSVREDKAVAYVVADLGATNLRGAAFSDDLAVLAHQRLQTPCAAIEQYRVLEELLVLLGAQHARAVGVGVAARVRWPSGHVVSGGILALADVPLAAVLQARTGVPTVVDNDANLAALAEARLGAARGAQLSVTVTIGTGIGGGITHNGALIRGRAFAADLGHMPMFTGGPTAAADSRDAGKRSRLAAHYVAASATSQPRTLWPARGAATAMLAASSTPGRPTFL